MVLIDLVPVCNAKVLGTPVDHSLICSHCEDGVVESIRFEFLFVVNLSFSNLLLLWVGLLICIVNNLFGFFRV